MAKRIKFKTSDIFSIEVSKNEFVFGRILFDPSEQYIKKIPEEKQFSYLDWFSGCILIETYLGVFSSLDKVVFSRIAVTSSFVSKNIFKREDVKIIDNKPVNPQKVSFPEVISTYDSKYYFSVGELKIPININSQGYDQIHVYPSFGDGYWELVATLVWSGREDLVEKEDVKEVYFSADDLRVTPKKRNKIYALIGEDPNQSYYELALKHGFDLARLY
jgi:hypothetical protein